MFPVGSMLLRWSVRFSTWLSLTISIKWEKGWRTNNRQLQNKDTTQKSRGMVVIPYVQGLTERSSRVFKKHGISTGMKPHTSLRKILVHPKDKVDPADKTDCIYEIPCKNCNYTYIGETGRKFSTRLKEHKKEEERLASKSSELYAANKKAISRGTKQISDSGPCSSIQPCDRLGWCKSVTNGVWLRCPVYPGILVD